MSWRGSSDTSGNRSDGGSLVSSVRSRRAIFVVVLALFAVVVSPAAMGMLLDSAVSVRAVPRASKAVASAMDGSMLCEGAEQDVSALIIGAPSDLFDGDDGDSAPVGEASLAVPLPADARLRRVSADGLLVGYETDLDPFASLSSLERAMSLDGWVLISVSREGVVCASFMRDAPSENWAFVAAYPFGGSTSVVLRVA